MMVLNNKRIAVGFRNTRDAVEVIGHVISEIGANIGFANTEELDWVVEGVTGELAPLIYSQVLERLAVGFAEEEICIGMDYSLEPDQEDELDVSFLKMVPLEVDKLELGIVVTEEEYARYLGAEKLTSLSTPTVEVRLVCLNTPTNEQDAELISEGGNDVNQG